MILQYNILYNVMLMEGSQDNMLITVDTITLQSDMIYTIQVSFSNLDGQFNMTKSINLSTCVTFIVQR